MRLIALVGALPLITTLCLAAETPQPRVCGTYCSWPQGGYQFRESQDALFAGLGWAYTRVENTQVTALVDELGRFDIYFPPALYNYDHAQPFEQHPAQWRAFLERGGILVSADSNYGSQIGWLTSLGEGLELSARNCPTGTAAGRDHRIVPTAPDDPFCPDPETTLPWAHFDRVGPGWKVLATCDDGHPVCVRADIGKGVLIAANTYGECGWPTEAYLRRIWAYQAPRVMQDVGEVSIDRGVGAVGANALTVNLAGSPQAGPLTVRRLISSNGQPWDTREVPLADGRSAASFPCQVAPGRTEVQVEVCREGQPVWWTTWYRDTEDLPGRLRTIATRLDGIAPDLRGLPEDGYLWRRWRELSTSCEALQGAAETLAQGTAGVSTASDWSRLATSVGDLEECAQPLAGRATVAARSLRETGDAARPFAVVRSVPLVKLHRDEAPEGSCAGELRMAAARGEAESLQVGVVPLGDDVTGLNVHLEPLQGPGGAVIGPESCELHRVCYVHVKGPSAGVPAGRSWWPDPLLPADGSFAARNVCQPLWVDLWVSRDAPAGVYRGDLVVWNDARTERIPVVLEVLDFSLPAEHSLRQVFVFRAPQITQRYDGQADYKLATPVETYLRMMDVCLKRRVGAQAFGWEGSPDPVSAMAYMGETETADGWQFDFRHADRIWQHQWDSGMRTLFAGFTPGCGSVYGAVTTEGYWAFLEAYLRALVPHLEQKGWLESAVWYMVDECWNEDAVLANLRLADLMDRVAPELKRLSTAPRDPRLYGKADIWVPGGLPEAHPEDASWRKLIEGWSAPEIEKWWYICCGPVHPYPNFFIDYPTIDPRMVMWLTWKYNKTGFLYWGVEYFGDPREMTPDGPTENYPVGPSHMGNGDGTLCYWGPNSAFYPSVRLNAIRDGLEDYEYFVMLKRLADESEAARVDGALVARAREVLAVDPAVLRITDGSPNFTYSLDPAPLTASRREMAELIVALEQALR